MIIKHYLANGTEVGSVSGKRITADQFSGIYKILKAINERKRNDYLRTNKES